MNAIVHIAQNVPRRLWLRVEDFLLLNESGALASFAKSELIDGEVFTVNAQFQRHSYVKSELAYRLRSAIDAAGLTLLPLVEVSVVLPPFDMPEPDIVVRHGPATTGPVAVADVALVVEVADATLATDRGRKSALYARHSVPEYWVIDLAAGEIVRHWQPGVQGFEQRDVTPFGGMIASATIAQLAVSTSGLT